jgi:DNA-binding MarR family transcriptional regulator
MLFNKPELESSLMMAFYNFYNLIELILKVKTDASLTLRESFLLIVVEQLEEKKLNTVTNVAHELKLTTSGASQSISTLINKKYLIRTNVPDDRRIYMINLTEKGKEVLRAQDAFRKRILDEMSKELGAIEKKVLINAVGKLNNFINKDFERMKTDHDVITDDKKNLLKTNSEI